MSYFHQNFMNFMKIGGIHDFSHFLESGRKSRGPPLPWPWPRPRPLPKTRAGAGADPHRRGRREAAADGCALCVGSGPSARPLRAKQFRERAGCARSGPPVRPSRQSEFGNAPCPRARGLRCVPRGKAIPGTRRIRALGASDASLGAKQFQERAGSALRASDPPARGQAISWRARGPVTVDVCRRGLYGALPSQSEATKLSSITSSNTV